MDEASGGLPAGSHKSREPAWSTCEHAGVTVRPPASLAGHLFDLSSLSGRAGHTAAYSEKGLVFISVCDDNENCSPGVGKCCGFLPVAWLSHPQGCPQPPRSCGKREE